MDPDGGGVRRPSTAPPTLDAETAALVRLSAALAGGSDDALDAALDAAASVARPEAVEEALLQSYLFLGYPAALNAFGRWRRRQPRPAAPPAPDDWPAWVERGAHVCERVYAGQYPRLRANIRALHPDMERWMVAEGYGKVLGRPGLELRARELCIVALLAGQRAEPQLYAHLRGALNAGARAEEVEAALSLATEHVGEERRGVAEAVWREVSARERRARGAAGRPAERE